MHLISLACVVCGLLIARVHGCVDIAGFSDCNGNSAVSLHILKLPNGGLLQTDHSTLVSYTNM